MRLESAIIASVAPAPVTFSTVLDIKNSALTTEMADTL
jgi:hypothetical protein